MMNTYRRVRRKLLQAALAATSAILTAPRAAWATSATPASPLFTKTFEPLRQKYSARWIDQGKSYVALVNRYHDAMDAYAAAQENNKKAKEPPEPKPDPRKSIAATVLSAAKTILPTATESEIAQWRAAFPFGYDALIDAYKDDSCSVDQCLALDGNDCAIIVRNFKGHELSLGVKRGSVWKFDPSVHCFGRSHSGKVWAFATDSGIDIRDGFDGKKLRTLAYPRGNEGLPSWLKLGPTKAAQRASVIIPFNDAMRLLLANETGIYLLDANASGAREKIRRLHPHEFDRDGPYTWPKNKDEGDRALSLSMVHAALSPDEKFIALGDQDSAHVLLNPQGKVLATASPGNYPHHALFDRASKHVLFNECHLYSGMTGSLALDKIDASGKGDAKSHELVPVDDVLRVYSATAGADAIYLGGSGYMNSVEIGNGRGIKHRWRHHVGGSVKAIDFTRDDRFLWAASYSGLLVRYETRAAGGDPMRIGNSPLWDTERWLFLDDMSAPIPW
jgi:hypothetical protein